MSEQFKYPFCQRGESHKGEFLNLVCLQKGCSQQSVICDVCYQHEHEGHKIKPLKVLLNNAKKYLKNTQSPDPWPLKELILKKEQSFIDLIGKFEQTVYKIISNISLAAKTIYPALIQQLESNIGFSNSQLIESLQTLKEKQMPYDAFTSFMHTLLSLPIETDFQKIKQKYQDGGLQSKILSITKRIEDQFLQQELTAQFQLKKIETYLQELKLKTNGLLKFSKYQFKQELKHQGIKLPSSTVAKSIQSDSYRLALLSPALPKGKVSQRIGFKIKKKVSEWLAVGMCYNKRVAKSNYNFDYLTLGHGGYLLSCNGGAWSEIDSSINGTFSGFRFSQGDQIVVDYNPKQASIMFTNSMSNEKRSLLFRDIPDDNLHFCALFYFNQDEIEFEGEIQ